MTEKQLYLLGLFVYLLQKSEFHLSKISTASVIKFTTNLYSLRAVGNKKILAIENGKIDEQARELLLWIKTLI